MGNVWLATFASSRGIRYDPGRNLLWRVDVVNPTLIPVVLFGGIFAVVVVAILAKTFAQVVCHWQNVSLKMRLADAGYSAEEIERIIDARPGDTDPEFDVPPAKKPAKRMAS